MVKRVSWLRQLSAVYAKTKGTDDRRPVEVRYRRIHFDRHKRAYVASPHEPGNIVAQVKGRKHLACGRECPLSPHEHDRVILARVLARNIMEPRCAHRRRYVS